MMLTNTIIETVHKLNNSPVDGDEIINQLFPNIPILIAHIVSSIVLILVLWRLVYAPFRRLLHSRHLIIKSKLDDAADKQALANQDRGAANQILNSAKVEADEIISFARGKAYGQRKQILDQAQEEAMRITNQSKHDLVRQKREMEKQIKQEIENISLQLASQILEVEINAKKHQNLIDDFLKEVK